MSPGQFVALDAGPRTPLGLLGRVVRASAAGPRATSLEIQPATLAEAVPEGHIGRADLRSAAAGATTRDFRSALTCSGEVGAGVTGSLGVALDPTFDLDWEPWGVTSARAAVTLRGDARLSVSVGAAASCSLGQTSLATWDAPPLRFFAGPIPVVIVPRTTLYVSATAEASGAVVAGLHGALSATAGLRYDGDVHTIGSFEPRLTATTPASRVTASVAATLTPSVTFLIYGQAGPRFDLSTGLHLDASAGADPWWTLTAPVALSAGFSAPAVADLEIPQQTVFSRSFALAQAETAETPPPSAPQPGPVAERARINWDTGGSDVDLHVWDEHGNHSWFGNPDAIPGGRLSGDDRDGFGPELFSAAEAERLTFGLCYFDDHGTGPARVSARVTGADGSTRDSTHTLYRNHDSVLLDPGAGGFVPPDGWCSG